MTHHLRAYFQHSFLLLVLALLAPGLPVQVMAQISQGKMPQQWNTSEPVSIEWMEFEALDMEQLASEDAATAKFKDAPWRFGIEHEVLWDAETHGTWTQEGAYDVWRLGVRAELATSWSFYFSSFDVPKGGELFVWNASREAFLGSFTYANEKPWGGLAIGLLDGNGVVLEYRQPQGLTETPTLIVSQAVQGYRSLLKRAEEVDEKMNVQGPFGNSGSCNINVNCPEGADWQIEKTAVALIVNGGFASCSGSMINNTANDGTPYFLTANHCLGNPNTWTYYFNHESSTCSGSSGPTSMSISGGNLLVADGGADVALIELSSAPPASWDVEYAGWDASGATPENATGIHHPSGDVKKICFEEDSPYTSSTGGAQVWWIDNWEAGVTEPGSSGSPLFDQNHRIIGQLYGGAAACSGSVNNGAFDYYGRFNVSWGLGVSEYLDPSNSGTLVLDGYPSGYNSDVGCTDADACNYDPAALVDDGSCIINGSVITFVLLTDNYPAETTWNITDASGSIVLEGGPYDGSQTTYTSTACLAPGCYTLTVNDSYGDGLQHNGVIGDYTLTDESGTVLAEMIEGGDFGSQAVHDFCLEEDITEGCANANACNYNAAATDDNSSCVYASGCDYCSGATDGSGSVVDGDTDNDGVCDADEIAGCQEEGACNYNPDATDAAACEFAADGFDCDGNTLSCAEDINGNGTVEVSDVLLLLSDFGCTSDCTSADVDGDGAVSVADILLLLAAFGEEC
ncbi:MAG: trypsin-like peptidase domain-containing protein [Bacteroidota bacterium]|nr:trypsin-like peptidase domain-containing protein [Bacteroidota bacterium]